MSSGAGCFISFEGADGAGKTTQVRLLAERLRQLGHDVVRTREPGGTALGEQLRALILPRADTTNDPTAELLLLNAARAQLVAEVIRPALERGAIVLADRYADATLAYQGYGRGGDLDELRTVIRIATRGAENFFDRMGVEFRARVRDGFLELARAEPERWLVVNGSGEAAEVAERIWAGLAAVFA